MDFQLRSNIVDELSFMATKGGRHEVTIKKKGKGRQEERSTFST